MKVKINSIKNRILSGFLVIILIMISICSVCFYYLEKIESVRVLNQNISKIEILTLNLIKVDNDFLDIESVNPNFFITGQSNFILKRDSIKSILAIYQSNLPALAAGHLDIDSNLSQISKLLESYDNAFELLKSKVHKRGFKDHGLEGEMRKYAHELESEIELSSILTLRRHEKDFILRSDIKYLEEHDKQTQRIISELKSNKTDPHLINKVLKYSELFKQLTEIEKEIGFTSNEGLRNDLNMLTFEINQQFKVLSSEAQIQAERLIYNAFAFFIIIVVVCIVLSIFISYFLSKKLSRPVKKLSALMNKFLDEKSNYDLKVDLINPTSEIENLSKAFFSLMKQTKLQLEEIKLKSLEMRKNNKELKKVNEELDRFIYSTAHDLRSPLTSILGLINLADKDQGESQKKLYLSLMRSSIYKMEAFIKEIVDYSKNKKLEVDIVEIDLKALIYDVFEDHKYIPACQNIELIVESEYGDVVFSDVTRLKIILTNLISNAIRYSDQSKKHPFIKVQVQNTKSRFIIIFSDNGLGIEESHLNSIFNMFYRANETSSGSGLGLFILKETIETLQGHVEVSSQIGEGTSYIISMPNKKSNYSIKSQKLVFVD
jgi:signal transduction histidine kinase